ncbi:FixH family protein [Pontibacter oryzae]|uniref:Nitrogen fixation protein FixH n=1 Tax=Pontibacter oryzae TaxID=2304593 RepID=A0A399SD97_9BACT|nr:FixH family protein [Pontibacter oryzae]RIJ41680.1 nitrogen fixation protein FixH [Pontibacter oryzae]
MATTHHTQTLWPYGIVAAIILFAGYIIFFVTKAMRQDVDLVSKDYYAQEIAYQDQINKVRRTAAVGDVDVDYQPGKQAILMQLPAGFRGQKINGTISFFRPSDETLDVEVPLQLGRDQSQQVSIEALKPGHWRVRVNFSANQQAYFAENSITIQ